MSESLIRIPLIPDLHDVASEPGSIMRIRRATLLDVDRIAAIDKMAFYNGGGHERYLALQVVNATESVNCAEQLVLVVHLDGLVVAYAIWERWGNAGDYWKDQKTVYPLELDHKRGRFDSDHNPALTLPAVTAALWRAHSYACHSTITQHFTGTFAECYYLHRLVTHRDYERRGAASMLVQWGVARALREGVVYGCETTARAFLFYKRFGMQMIQVGGGDGWVVRSPLIPVVIPATEVNEQVGIGSNPV